MIRFVAHLPHSGKTTLGLALLPTDLARVLGGEMLSITMSEVDIEPRALTAVMVCSVRDEMELRKLLREAGVDPKMIGLPEVVI